MEGYTIQRGVGRGGFGEVYYAVSDGGKEVALKYLRDNPSVELRGVSACLNLKSPHLVSIYDVRQSSVGEWFVVMEYVSGPSLRELLVESAGGLGVAKATYLVREIGRGLTYLHERGIVHRDLKPGNVFWDEGYVKIGDYGLSKHLTASQHSGQTVSVGTVHYMAPEIGSGNYDRTIDLYALGVMLYEMLVGRVPYAGSTVGEILMKHLTAEPEVSGLAEPFPTVLRRALAKDPRERYGTVEEMVGAIFSGGGLESTLATFEPASLSTVAGRVAHRARVPVAAGGLGSGSSNRGDPFPGPPPPPVDPARRGPAERMGSAGGIVDQVRDEAQRVWHEIVDRTTEPPAFPQRSRWTAGLLGLLLGAFGVHRFYLGYNRVGILQILATCFTGVGALWGMIEGVMILANGNMRDVYGRPLLSRDPTERSLLARLAFAAIAFIALLGAMASAVAATVIEDHATRTTWSGSRSDFNAARLLYIVSVAALAVAAFGIWKATHRAGFGLWRATVRPALMSIALAVGGAGAVSVFLIAQQQEQLVAMSVSVVMSAIFAVLWHVRGPEGRLLPTDVYWDGAVRNLFILAAIVLWGGGIASVIYFSEVHRERLQLPSGDFAAMPLILGVCGTLAIASVLEARYRARRRKRAMLRFGDESATG